MDRVRPTRLATTQEPWTAAKVIKALQQHYLYDVSCAVSFSEVELQAHHDDDKYTRRADLLTVHCHGARDNIRWTQDRQKLYDRRPGYCKDPYPLNRLPHGWRTGFEIKVSRADLRVDLKQQYKHGPLAKVTNELFLVYPKGLWTQKPHPSPHMQGHMVDEFKLPYNMGRIEVFHDPRPQWLGKLRAKIVKLPHYNMTAETPDWFISMLLLNRRPFYSMVDQAPS